LTKKTQNTIFKGSASFLKGGLITLLFSGILGLMGCGATLPSKITVHSPKLLFAKTSDDWQIALHRFQPRTIESKTPVMLLVTSPNYNATFWSLKGSVHFARFFAKRGWDVWALSFRGAGRSHRPGFITWDTLDELTKAQDPKSNKSSSYQWTIADYINKDLPAALNFIRNKTGVKLVTCIGHSFGGSLLLAYLSLDQGEKVGQAVVIAPPFKYISPAPDIFLLSEKKQEVRKRFSSPISNILFFNPNNIDRSVLNQSTFLAMESLPPEIATQFLSVATSGELKSSQGRRNYFKALKLIEQPILLICGKKDNLAPPEGVRAVYEKIASDKKVFRLFSRDNLYQVDYGHDDLILGKWAKQEVYPYIDEWLNKNKNE